jgi:hypothetical protein
MKSSSASLKVGDSSVFTILLWSQERQGVSLSSTAPPGFFVLVQPEHLDVGPGIGREKVASGLGYVSASSAKVFVKNEGASPGEYPISIYARGSSGSGYLSFSTVVVLNVKVVVPGESVDSATIPRENEVVVYDSYTSEKIEEQDGTLLLILLVISILAASFIIYRYA